MREKNSFNKSILSIFSILSEYEFLHSIILDKNSFIFCISLFLILGSSLFSFNFKERFLIIFKYFFNSEKNNKNFSFLFPLQSAVHYSDSVPDSYFRLF